jgi:hypothetical protein
MTFKTNDSIAMTLDDGGKLGIGTTSPEHHLHVTEPGATNEDGIVKIGGSAASLGLELRYNQASNTETDIIANPTYTNVNAIMRLAVDGDANPNQIVLKGDGNVGIGIDSPATPLHIKKAGSTSAVQEFIRIENNAGGGASAGSSINFHHYHAGGGPAGGAKAASITAQNMASWPAGTPSSYSTGLAFGTLHENTFAERMRISSNGNVGIGTFTSPPASKLHLESGNAHNKLSITSTASGGTGYDAVIDLLGSAANSETAINMGINGDADREQIKAYQSYLSLRANNVERISYQPTQGSVYENIHENFTGNLNLSLL